jgi:zinc and cadmium transporter
MIYWIIVFASLGSVGAIAGSALLLFLSERIRQALVPRLLSYATGTLLGAVFLAMIPNALALASPPAVSATVLAGIVAFFALEKLLLWRHCHDSNCAEHGSAGPLILIGDGVHNAADGLIIAAAFLTSVPVGIAVSLAVLAHELPQELGDFSILLDAGYAPTRALAYNCLSAIPTLPAAIIAFYWLDTARAAQPFVLAASAASFIYVAIADLVPSLHRRAGNDSALLQFVLLLAGIATIAFVSAISHQGVAQWSG